jgi:WD40 repeat protein
MSLTGEKRKRLEEALLAAFPSWSALARLVRFGLDENLEAIVSARENLTTVVSELVSWAEARGKLAALLAGARAERPGNSAFDEEAGGAAEDEGPCPFPGLSFFDEAQAKYFFGREAEVGEALGLLGGVSPHRRWLQIDGPSGAGKSSFARAGLVPAVRARGVAGGPARWAVAVMRPGSDPVASLARAIREALPGLGEKLASDQVEASLRGRTTALRGFVADYAGGQGVLLLVDQLEEVFTLAGADRAGVERFDALVDDALGDAEGSLYLVSTIRSDFTGKMGEMPRLEKRLSTQAGRYYLRAMGREGLLRAIEEPAKQAGLVWAGGLPARIVEDAASSAGALPLVAHALFAVWGERAGRELRAEVYEALGGVGGALARSADGIVASLGEDGSRRARRVLLRLVKIGRGSEDTRQTSSREEVLAAGGSGDEAAKVLARLSGGRDPGKPAVASAALPRLVVVSGGERGVRVDLVHEALIQRWGMLGRWIEEERRALELRDDVEEAARVWEANGAAADSLPKGRMLGRFREVDRAGLKALALRFLGEAEEAERQEEAARKALEEKERRRARRTIAAIATAAIVLAVLALGFGWQSKKAREAEVKAQWRASSERGLRLSAMAEQPERAMEVLQLGIKEMVGSGHDPATAPHSVVEGMIHGFMQIRDLAVLQGHTGDVQAVAFSPDGTRVVTGSADKTARLWDTKEGKLIAALLGHTGDVQAVAFSPDGTRVVTGSRDNTARLWDAKDGKPIVSLQGHTESVVAVTFSPDGLRVLTGSWDKTARLWDAKDGKLMATLLGHTQRVTAAAFSPDGTRVITGSEDADARLWDVKESRSIATLQGHQGSVEAVAFSPDGTRIVTGSWYLIARLWDAKDCKPIATLEGHSLSVWTVVFSPDGTKVATGSEDRTARLWDARDGKLLAILEGHMGSVSSVAFSPDGKQVVTGSNDNTARLWDTEEGKLIAALQGHTDVVRAVAFSLDGTRMATGSNDKTTRLWNAKEGHPLVTLLDHMDSVKTVAFSSDGTRLMTRSEYEPARMWDVKEGRPIATFQRHTGTDEIVAFSPDGTRIITVGEAGEVARLWDAKGGEPIATLPGYTSVSDMDIVAFSPNGTRIVIVGYGGSARLWNAKDGKPIATFLGHAESVTSVAFSADGTLVLTGSKDKTVRLWDGRNGNLIATLQGHTQSVTSVAFSPNKTRILTGSEDKTARLWDAKDGKSIATLLGHTQSVRAVAFSPDGARILTGSEDKTARLWDAEDGNPIATLVGHAGFVKTVTFSPDGTRVATGSYDKTARLWDAATGDLLAILPGHLGRIGSLAFSPDGRHLATASGDGTARIWAATPEGFLIQACQYLHHLPAYAEVAEACAPYLDRTP